MTYPTKPPAAYDYVTFQTGSPTTPLPANQVAADLANHKTAIDASIDFAKLVQRSDGNLQNGAVKPETLSAGTIALIGKWTPRGTWLTATAYAVNDLVEQPAATGNNYVALVAHTSGVFATDLAAGKWQLIDAAAAQLAGNQTFTGANTFSGASTFSGTESHSNTESHSGAATFTAAVNMTGGTPTVATKAVGDSTTAPASTAFVQAAVGKVYTQVFTATGTYTPHAGMVSCIIEAWGAGGGGGGTAATGASTLAAGGGGGAGSYSRLTATAATIGASKAVAIGTAGTGGAAGNNAGGAGGDTTVGVTLVVAKGGSGGTGSPATGAGTGGAGGVAGTGDVTSTGQPGGGGSIMSGNLAPTGGGGSSSVGGGGAQGLPASGGSAVTGAAGTGHGAGGAAGASYNSSAAAAGGAGSAGYIVITEFCNQ